APCNCLAKLEDLSPADPVLPTPTGPSRVSPTRLGGRRESMEESGPPSFESRCPSRPRVRNARNRLSRGESKSESRRTADSAPRTPYRRLLSSSREQHVARRYARETTEIRARRRFPAMRKYRRAPTVHAHASRSANRWPAVGSRYPVQK